MTSSFLRVQVLINLLKDHGIKHIVFSPGSRNAPLVLGFNSDNFFIKHVVVDERSAAFVALGIAQQKEEPVVIKFTAKMAVRLLSGKDLSSSKASYTCELSLFRLHLNEHVEIVEETVKSAVADGIAPHWNRMFKN